MHIHKLAYRYIHQQAVEDVRGLCRLEVRPITKEWNKSDPKSDNKYMKICQKLLYLSLVKSTYLSWFQFLGDCTYSERVSLKPCWNQKISNTEEIDYELINIQELNNNNKEALLGNSVWLESEGVMGLVRKGFGNVTKVDAIDWEKIKRWERGR